MTPRVSGVSGLKPADSLLSGLIQLALPANQWQLHVMDGLKRTLQEYYTCMEIYNGSFG